MQAKAFNNYLAAKTEFNALDEQLSDHILELASVPVLIVCDDADFVSENLRNFLWVAFTRCNPSHDLQGVGAVYENKHWGCAGPLIFDARIKPHHAPPVETDRATEKKVDKLFEKGGSLYGIL